MPQYRRPADQIRDLKRIDQQILNLRLDARGSELYSYSVSWTTASGSAPSVGNGSLTGRYRRVGTLVLVNIRLVIGSTTSQGTGTWGFSPPFAVDTGSDWAGAAVAYNDSNGNWISGSSMIQGSGDRAGLIVGILGPVGGASGVVRTRAGIPVSWDTNSSIFFSIWYGTTE